MADSENEVKNADQLAGEARLDAAIPEILQDQVSDEAAGEYVDNLRAVDSLGGLLLIVPMASSVFGLNHVAAVWTNERCQNLAGALVPVLRKYPFGQKILNFVETGAGVEELALMTMLAPLVVQSYSAYQLDVAAKNPRPESEAKDVQEVATNDTTNE